MANQVGVQECEDYIQKHGVQDILKNCISKMCQEHPLQPYTWLKEYFDKLDRVRKSDKSRRRGKRKKFLTRSLSLGS